MPVPKFPMVKPGRRDQVTDRYLGAPLADQGRDLPTSTDKAQERKARRGSNRRQ